ncbi:hypothetical protein CF165_23990 [Amycolatopsis vastitatis]|uniref:Transposase IS4-like domain-containing protein n=1 Tax=Amycolatopsis vastitatis TaxID=1905142 RepID=A0A229T389_9PSEU|nr:transposase [Amycolatopsis vastitatis]OXM65384.1 hypothetical protein CF165_23990 [Amycolatopsis vastitatis]
MHLACDGHGRPLSVLLTGGNVDDCTQLTQVMTGIEFHRPGLGRRATRPNRVLADKGYSRRAIRSYLRRRHIPATIPERRDQRGNRLKQFRAIANRFDKTATSYRSMIDLATLLILA